MLRKIILPVRGDGKGDNVFAHAAVLAKRFNAHIEVTHCRPRAEDLMPYGVPVPAFMRQMLKEQTTKVADVEEQGLREEIVNLAKTFNIEMTENPTGVAASVSWVEESGRQADIIKRHGRLADLICVAKPDVDRNLGENSLKAALFQSGRPVLMCPPVETVNQQLGSNIVVSWNGSLEASRAIALTLDLLEKADKVTVLTGGKNPSGATSEGLLNYLQLRGISASLNNFESNRGNVGARLLAECEALGADIMVMGAYGVSHERETIFGGNTQTIVDQAKLPVVLVH